MTKRKPKTGYILLARKPGKPTAYYTGTGFDTAPIAAKVYDNEALARHAARLLNPLPGWTILLDERKAKAAPQVKRNPRKRGAMFLDEVAAVDVYAPGKTQDSKGKFLGTVTSATPMHLGHWYDYLRRRRFPVYMHIEPNFKATHTIAKLPPKFEPFRALNTFQARDQATGAAPDVAARLRQYAAWLEKNTGSRSYDRAVSVPLPRRNPAGRGKRRVRAVRRNPTDPLADARKLYDDFHGEAPKTLKTVDIPAFKGPALTVGKVLGIIYVTKRDGEKAPYLHEFDTRARPTLLSSHDGRALHLTGGAYRFTDRGIVDDPKGVNRGKSPRRRGKSP